MIKLLLIITLLLLTGVSTSYAQERNFDEYPGAIRIHVKSFFGYLDKSQKDKKYLKDAERKLKYIEGKDAAIASQLRTELERTKQALTSTTPATPKAPVTTSQPTHTATPAVAQMHIDSYNKYVQKAQSDAKYIDDAERKLKYIEGKDAALAAQLRPSLDALKQAQAASRPAPPPVTNTPAVKQPVTSNYPSSPKVAEMHVKNFYKYIEQAQTDDDYVTKAETKLKYIEGKDPALAAQLRPMLEQAQSQKAQNADARQASMNAMVNLKQEFKYATDGVSYMFSGQADNIDEFEQAVKEYKTRTNALFNNAESMAKVTSTPPDRMIERDMINYKNMLKSSTSDLNRDLQELEANFEQGGNAPRMTLMKCMRLEANWYTASKIFPNNTEYADKYRRSQALLAKNASRDAIEARVAKNDQEFIENTDFKPVQMNDPTLDKLARAYYADVKPANHTGPIKVKQVCTWQIKKNALGIPLYQWLYVQLSSKNNETGQCHLNEVFFKKEYMGAGTYGNIVRYRHQVPAEPMGCKNAHK